MIDLQKIDSIDVHFIIGPGRSGTTLLVQLLNFHSNSIAIPEVKHVLHFYKKYKNINSVTSEVISDYKKYYEEIKKKKKYYFVNAPEKNLLDALEIGQAINFAQLSKIFHLVLAGVDDYASINCIIDKNPQYTFQVNRLKTIFPESKFLVLIRDFRAYILSNLQHQKPNEKKRSTLYYAWVWRLYLHEINLLKKQLNNTLLIEKYEDLVLQKEATVERIFHFFNLKFESTIFDFHLALENQAKVLKTTEQLYVNTEKKISDLSSPINASRLFSWKEKMTEKNQKEASIICKKYAETYDYTSNTFQTSEFMSVYLKSLFSFLRTKLYKLSTLVGNV